MPGDILLRIFEADGSGRFLSILVFFGFFRRGQDKELPPVAAVEETADDIEAQDQPPANFLVPSNGNDNGGAVVLRIRPGKVQGPGKDTVKYIFELAAVSFHHQALGQAIGAEGDVAAAAELPHGLQAGVEQFADVKTLQSQGAAGFDLLHLFFVT